MENMDFLKELQDFMLEEDTKALEIKITGEDNEYKSLIDTPDKANYFLKVLEYINRDIESINAQADRELEKVVSQINTFREHSLKPLLSRKEFFEKSLESFTKVTLEGSKKRNIQLPYGTLQLKKNAPKMVYDEDVVIEWLKENNIKDSIKTVIKESIDKKQVKSLGTINGGVFTLKDGDTIVPGIEIQEQEDSFFIK